MPNWGLDWCYGELPQDPVQCQNNAWSDLNFAETFGDAGVAEIVATDVREAAFDLSGISKELEKIVARQDKQQTSVDEIAAGQQNHLNILEHIVAAQQKQLTILERLEDLAKVSGRYVTFIQGAALELMHYSISEKVKNFQAELDEKTALLRSYHDQIECATATATIASAKHEDQ
jgi:hypothetical protein